MRCWSDVPTMQNLTLTEYQSMVSCFLRMSRLPLERGNRWSSHYQLTLWVNHSSQQLDPGCFVSRSKYLHSAYSRKLVWTTSRVHRPLTLFSKPRKSKSHICCSWRKHWKVLSRAMQLPSFQMSWPFAHRNAVQCVAATKHSLAKGRRKYIKAIWDALDWRIGVYKSVGEDELALYVLKSSFGTWRKLKRILDITPEEFNAALLEFWSSHSWPPMSDTVFSDTHNISKWCNISRYFLSVKLVTNVHNFLQNLL